MNKILKAILLIIAIFLLFFIYIRPNLKIRLKTKEQERSLLNDRRIIEKYLFLPLKIENEWRWLERAKIGQIYRIRSYGIYKWVNDAWIDNNQNEDFYSIIFDPNVY